VAAEGRHELRRSLVALTGALAVPVAVLALAFGGVGPAVAVDELVIDLPRAGAGSPGSVVELITVALDPAMAGTLCTVRLTGRNNPSVHRGNDVIVTSGTSSVTFTEVEAVPGPVEQSGGSIRLGPTVTVRLRYGQSGQSSGRWTVTVDDCVGPPPPTTTTAPVTTTVVASTSIAPAPTTTMPPNVGPPPVTVLPPNVGPPPVTVLPPPNVGPPPVTVLAPPNVGPPPAVLGVTVEAPSSGGLSLPPLTCASRDCRINALQHRLRRGTMAVDPPCRIPTTQLVQASNQDGPTEGPTMRCDMVEARSAFLRVRIARPADGDAELGTGEAEVTVTTPDGDAPTLAIDVDARMRVTLGYDDEQLEMISPAPERPGTAVMVDDIAKGRETVFEMQVRPRQSGQSGASLLIEAIEVDPGDEEPIDHQVYRSDVVFDVASAGGTDGGGDAGDEDGGGDADRRPWIDPGVAGTGTGTGPFGIVGLTTLLVALAAAAAYGAWQLWSRHTAATTATATAATGAAAGTGVAAATAAAAPIAKGSVVISYAREDAKLVERLRSDLAEAGYETWVDTAAIPGGSTWKREIVEAIGRAGTMVVVLSRHSAASEHVATEVGIARSEAKRVMPVRVDEVELGGELRYDIGSLQHIDLFPAGRWDDGMAELLGDLESGDSEA